MPTNLNKFKILENLEFLSEWLRIKYPNDIFELLVVGGAAMALNEFKDQTRDIDILLPEILPAALKEGIAHVSKAKRLPPEWINSNAANILKKLRPTKGLPEYFNETSRTIDIGDNLKITLIGRQALIGMKLLASTPSYTKHTDDIRSLNPRKKEIEEAVRFVLSIDNDELRKKDLRIVLKAIGFDFYEFTENSKR
jgi:hypothetical protein